METATSNALASKTSRVGKRPVEIPKGVTVAVNARKVQIKGPKGELVRELAPTTDIKIDGGKIHVSSNAPGRDASRLQGLMRALLAGMVKGVADGYERILELKGAGYRVELLLARSSSTAPAEHPSPTPPPNPPTGPDLPTTNQLRQLHIGPDIILCDRDGTPSAPTTSPSPSPSSTAATP